MTSGGKWVHQFEQYTMGLLTCLAQMDIIIQGQERSSYLSRTIAENTCATNNPEAISHIRQIL